MKVGSRVKAGGKVGTVIAITPYGWATIKFDDGSKTQCDYWWPDDVELLSDYD